MFKKIQSGLAKFFTKEKTSIVMWALLLIILVGALYTYNNGKLLVRDNMETGVADEKKVKIEEPKKEDEVKPNDAPVAGYEMQNVANPADLLPKDENSKFAELNANVMTAEGVAGGDMLEAGHHIGTIGQTLRNANLQIRSDPIIPKKDVGPWMTSTIEPDLARTPLELGER